MPVWWISAAYEGRMSDKPRLLAHKYRGTSRYLDADDGNHTETCGDSLQPVSASKIANIDTASIFQHWSDRRRRYLDELGRDEKTDLMKPKILPLRNIRLHKSKSDFIEWGGGLNR